jgi:hypothetical protein
MYFKFRINLKRETEFNIKTYINCDWVLEEKTPLSED